MHQAIINALIEASREFKLLDLEADERFAAGDFDAYHGKLRLRAKLIRDLPDQIAPLLDRDAESIELLAKLQEFGAMARDMLTGNSSFGLSVLLTHQESRTGDPNDLERLIIALEDTRSKPDWRALAEKLCHDDPMTRSQEGLDDGCFFCGAGVVSTDLLPQPHYNKCAWIETMDALGRDHPNHVTDESRLPARS